MADEEDLLGCGDPYGPAAPHERLVVHEQVAGVLQVPAVAAEVLEASHVSAEVGPLSQAAAPAQSVLQVRVNLDTSKLRFTGNATLCKTLPT